MSDSETNLIGKKIAIVTHRSLLPCIPGDDLMRFLKENGCNQLAYIKHPLLYIKESYDLVSEFSFFDKKKTKNNFKAYHWVLPEPLLYVKDFIYSLRWLWVTGINYDLFFGINNLNALAGLILKKMGRVKKVIYYSIDLHPNRFENKFINWLYHKIDRLCAARCDETWNVSPFMVKFRNKHDVTKEIMFKQFTVPIGIWLKEKEVIPPTKVKKAKMVYIGHIVTYKGIDLVIKAIPLIAKKIPQISFEIVGKGEQLKYLKQLSKDLHADQYIKFHGFISSEKKTVKIISNAMIGLATYNIEYATLVRNADPAKIKDYLAFGVPIIMTNTPANAQEIQDTKCGIIVDYTPESLTEAVVEILSNKKLWLEYRKNALAYVSQFDWNNIFTKNISRLL